LDLWVLYTEGKQTYVQLSELIGCSVRTIQRRLDRVKIAISKSSGRNVVVMTDTTYWGRGFGVMLFKDALSGENLHKQYVTYETLSLYRQGFETLKERGFTLLGIVCDGKKGLLQMYPDIPTQMCQFHQIKIIQRYLTRNPKLQASKELLALTQLLSKTDKESFVGGFNDWQEKWAYFLKERSANSSKRKTTYKHKRLRSAYFSLQRNLPYLFTWYDNPKLLMPNTTGLIEGQFSDLKNKLRNHNGLALERKIKFIDGFLKA
jgi:hypothetical protein